MKSRLLFLVLLVAGAFYLTWVLTAPEHEQEFVPSQTRTSKTLTSSTKSAVVAPPQIDARSIDPEIQKLADRLVEQTQTPLNDLETLGEFIELYRKSFNQLPVGSNEDLTAILTGHNPKKGVLFPPDSPMIIQGQLVDRWGTPYWLHPNTGASLEVRSAGPDRNLFSADDVILNQSPGGLGVTPKTIQ